MSIYGNNGTNLYIEDKTGNSHSGRHLNVSQGYSNDTWYHACITKNGTTMTWYHNGTSAGSGTFGAMTAFDAPISLGGQKGTTSYHFHGFLDQVMIIKGTYLSAGKASGLYGSGNGNTAITNRHSLVIHEEYANTTVTVNAATTFLLHSNNSTHHSQGSRKFFNDLIIVTSLVLF